MINDTWKKKLTHYLIITWIYLSNATVTTDLHFEPYYKLWIHYFNSSAFVISLEYTPK